MDDFLFNNERGNQLLVASFISNQDILLQLIAGEWFFHGKRITGF